MDQKEAIKFAKAYIKDIYEDEGVNDIGLEEISKDHLDNWCVTIGFTRREIADSNNLLMALGKISNRTYKTLTINQKGEVESMRNK
ncbi:hypothetical protein [Acetobacter pasteurianus]|uniref:Uncharacterized protein n=1 Tax=Acetobacter pasteurianus NBRC 3188 TaxID=1226663 RepID=A0A401WRS3_ACEPA|nr:hypothetical protein [Acetobacter pasteurianus]GCD52028.1 hypothetical protein NBRC3188_0725 [Acetobacter pasteurianus NBRC 3188]